MIVGITMNLYHLQVIPIIRIEKLEKIPFIVPLFHHLLFDDPLTVNQKIYAANSPEAEQYSELYAQNLIIQIANASMVFVLNYFANHEAIKIALYEQSMLSSRQVANSAMIWLGIINSVAIG